MKIQTSRFGEMEIDESKIINIENGLLGFEEVKKYILFSDDSTDFYWLQAVDKADLALPCMLPDCVCENYEVLTDAKVIEDLGIENDDDALILCAVVIPQDIRKTTVNLRAPIIINNVNKKGAQVVLDDNRYAIRHLVFAQ